MATVLFIILAIIVVVIIAIIAAYNGLVKGRNSVRTAWAQIENQLQRRLDLIPNLVETVKGYANHESGTLKDVTQARADASKALAKGDVDEISRTSGKLLASINAVREAYPDLKANENFRDLQEQLTQTENVIAASRTLYNNEVNDYNTSLQSFPRNIIAAMFGFRTFDLFNADEEARTPVRVSFTGNGD